MKENMKEYLGKKMREFREEKTKLDLGAIHEMERFLKENNGEFDLGASVRAMHDSEVVYITGIFLKDGKGSLQYAYESEWQEWRGTAPAEEFATNHAEVFDELVETLQQIEKKQIKQQQS